MQINLTGHHVDITHSLREYVNTKFVRLERHFDQINNVRPSNIKAQRQNSIPLTL